MIYILKMIKWQQIINVKQLFEKNGRVKEENSWNV